MYLKIRLLTIIYLYCVLTPLNRITHKSMIRVNREREYSERVLCIKNTTLCGEYNIPGQRAERATNLSLRRRLVHSFHCSFIRQNPHVLLYIIHTYIYIYNMYKEKNVVTEHRSTEYNINVYRTQSKKCI